MSYSSEVLADSPIAYWKLDDTKAVDASGNGNDFVYGAGVTVGGTALLSDGGKSAHGDGSHVIASRSAVATGLTGGNVTLEAWITIPAGNVNGPIINVGNETANGWAMGVGGTTFDNTGKQLIFVTNAIAWNVSGYTFSTGTHHVMAVRGAGNTVTCYVDGSSVATVTLSTPNTASTTMHVGGSQSRALSSTVQVDNVAIYASALSSGRVTAHYNSGSGDNSAVSADSPVVWLKLDETTTGTVSTADSSGNSHPITHTNSPTLAQASLLGDGSGTSVSYNGSSTFSTVPGGSWMATPSGLTVEARIRPNSGVLSAGGFIVAQWAGGTPNIFLLGVTSAAKLTAQAVTGGTLRTATGSTTLVAGTDYTVALRWTSGGNLEVFLNGVSDGSTAASGSIASSSTQAIDIGRAANSNGAGLTWNGLIDEVSITGSALSNGRMTARHAAAIAAPSYESGIGNPAGLGGAPVDLGGVGNSAGVSSSPVASSGAGNQAGVASAPVVTAGVGNQAGWAGSTEPDTQVTGIGNPAGLASAPVDTSGVGNSAGMAASGHVVAGIGNTAGWGSFTGSASVESVDIGLELGMAVSDQSIALGIETVPLGVGLGLEASDVVIHGIETVELGLELGVQVYTPKAWGEDVRTGRPTPRVDIVKRDGTTVTTFTQGIKPLTVGVNVLDKFGFTVDRSSDRAKKVKPVEHDARLYRGNVRMSCGPVGPGAPDASRTTYDCSDPRWHMWDGRRVIGRIPKRQILRNAGFTEGANGLAYWRGGWDSGSALAAAPEASVVSEFYAQSGKALQLGGVDKVVHTKAVVETAAVFRGNRPYAWEPLMNGFLPGGTAAITAVANTMTGPNPVVHITGHTADADRGDGYALSLRRAQAARLVVLARWPGATVTVEGKGETEPIAKGHNEAAYKKNRRVELDFDTTQTAVGHRQFYRQFGSITQPVSEKVPLPLTFAADMRILTWLGAPKDGWALLIRLTRGSKVIAEATAEMDEFTPRVRWKNYSATVEVPADGIGTNWEVRLYPPAGASRWANVGLWPEEQIGLFDVDQALHVKTWVEHVQDPDMGHRPLGIGTRTPLTGIPRTVERRFSERMELDAQLDWYTSIDRGLDIDYDQDRNEIVTYYPHQGTTVDVVLKHGRRGKVAAYRPLSSPALSIAANVIMQADGSGAARPEGYARDDTALGGTGPEAVISAEEETPLSELDEGAASALAASLRARPGWEVVLDPDFTTEFLDRTSKGDTMRLVLPDEDVDGLHRLALYVWDPETDIITATMLEEAP